MIFALYAGNDLEGYSPISYYYQLEKAQFNIKLLIRKKKELSKAWRDSGMFSEPASDTNLQKYLDMEEEILKDCFYKVSHNYGLQEKFFISSIEVK